MYSQTIRSCCLTVALSVLAVVLYAAPALSQATIVIVNNDGPGEGFNDPTPFTPVGGNNAATIGQARLNAFQFAANIWGNCINSSVTISVRANFDPQTCSATSATLGSANTFTYFRDFTNAPLANTWYPVALASALAGADLNGADPEIRATFNSSIDNNNNCLNGINWYYGLDGNPPGNDIDLVTVLLHEFCHGLGFLTPVDLTNGMRLDDRNDHYMQFLEDHGLGLWPALTNAQRQASAIDDPDLHWIGGNVLTEAAAIPLTSGFPGGHVRMHAPGTLNLGSSVSHFSTALTPNELMEPSYTGPDHTIGLALALMRDIGWTTDTTPPVINCPADITVECVNGGATDSDPAVAAFLAGASATDNIDPAPVITHDAPGFFPVGTTTTVTFTATDDCGNASSCQADVTVVDTTPPVVVCPADVVVECSVPGGVPVDDPQLVDFFAGFSASDACDSDPDVVDDAPDLFEGPCGTSGGVTVVTWTVTDETGNVSQCSAMVTVVDTTPPDLSVSLNRTTLWPPNHKMADIVATLETTDTCDPAPIFVLVSVTSDEPDNDVGVGDGNTVNDIQGVAAGTADTEFQLRSERQGGGDGRKYTIIYTAMDCSGNATSDTSCVVVPHDQGGGALAASGFTPDGQFFEPGVREFLVVIPGAGQAGATDPTRAFVGNLNGVLHPSASRRIDVDGDHRSDLVLRYDAESALRLKYGEDPPADGELMVEMAKQEAQALALRYETISGEAYLVADIHGLGAPIKIDPDDDGEGLDDVADVPEIGLGVSGSRLSLSLAEPGFVCVDVFTVQGRKVKTLVRQEMSAGVHELRWNGKDEEGRSVASGVYFYRVEAPGLRQARRIVRLQ